MQTTFSANLFMDIQKKYDKWSKKVDAQEPMSKKKIPLIFYNLNILCVFKKYEDGDFIKKSIKLISSHAGIENSFRNSLIKVGYLAETYRFDNKLKHEFKYSGRILPSIRQTMLNNVTAPRSISKWLMENENIGSLLKSVPRVIAANLPTILHQTITCRKSEKTYCFDIVNYTDKEIYFDHFLNLHIQGEHFSHIQKFTPHDCQVVIFEYQNYLYRYCKDIPKENEIAHSSVISGKAFSRSGEVIHHLPSNHLDEVLLNAQTTIVNNLKYAYPLRNIGDNDIKIVEVKPYEFFNSSLGCFSLYKTGEFEINVTAYIIKFLYQEELFTVYTCDGLHLDSPEREIESIP